MQLKLSRANEKLCSNMLTSRVSELRVLLSQLLLWSSTQTSRLWCWCWNLPITFLLRSAGFCKSLPVEGTRKATGRIKKKHTFSFLPVCFLYLFVLLATLRATTATVFHPDVTFHFRSNSSWFQFALSQHFQKKPHQTSSEWWFSWSDSSFDIWDADT